MTTLAIFSLSHSSLGRRNALPSQFVTWVQYCVRAEALVDLVTGNLPAEPDALTEWAMRYPDTLRANARMVDRTIVAIPHELDRMGRRALMQRFVDELTGGRRDRVRWFAAIHRGLDPDEERRLLRGDTSPLAPDDIPLARNLHGHIGYFDIDITVPSARKGAALVGTSRFHSSDVFRRAWADAVNGSLEASGHPERVDHRSDRAKLIAALLRDDVLEAVRFDRPKPVHIGGAGLGKIRRREPVISRPTAVGRRVDGSRKDVPYHLIDNGSRASEAARRRAAAAEAEVRARALALASDVARWEECRRLARRELAFLEELEKKGWVRRLQRLGGHVAIRGLAAMIAAGEETVRADPQVTFTESVMNAPPALGMVHALMAMPHHVLMQPLIAHSTPWAAHHHHWARLKATKLRATAPQLPSTEQPAMSQTPEPQQQKNRRPAVGRNYREGR